MKTITTTRLLACLPTGMAFIIMTMFSFTFVSAQPCPDNQIRVYRCTGHTPGCNSKCVNKIPKGWTTYCPCEAAPAEESVTLANEQNSKELLSVTVSPNPVPGSSFIDFFPKQSEKFRMETANYSKNRKLIVAK